MKRLLAVAALLLAGCMTPGGFRDSMNAWIGRHADQLVGQMGPPQSVYALSGGGAVLQWSSSRNAVIPVPQQTYGTVSAVGNTAYLRTTTMPSAYNIHLACTVRVTVSADGVIQSWNSEGNNCVR